MAEYAVRLEKIRRSDDLRDRIADTIIKRRVNELLEPITRWAPADPAIWP